MTLGFIIASTSWLLLMYSSTSIPIAIAAMAMFAIGEATQAPRYYEYVGALAPKDQVGTFMGFAFIPVAIGSFTAGVLSDYLRHNYLEQTMNPQMMWIILAAIGFGSTALMLIYNFTFARKPSA
jgi:dipeptide/tripeptide permease